MQDIILSLLFLVFCKLFIRFYKIYGLIPNFSEIIFMFENHSERILNYFENRSANAAAESFNAKLKAFRASFRGVSDMKFFLYRVTKIYA
ncbi:transposase [Bacteroides luti]|nr:transposase [Bacteroides luti]